MLQAHPLLVEAWPRPWASGGGDRPGARGRYADLIVGFGANVQPGQVVSLGSEVGRRA
jgi:hypothetical protein